MLVLVCAQTYFFGRVTALLLKHRFSAGAEPMPLLLDDILVHFDDDRSMAALDTLAEFSKTTQLLLFTHHERVREQALAAGGTVHDLLSA